MDRKTKKLISLFQKVSISNFVNEKGKYPIEAAVLGKIN